MSNLKVGMRVVAVTEYPENFNKRISIGDVGTLKSIEGDYVHVNFDNKGPEVIFSWRVEPVMEESKQMKPTDKITVEITLAELAISYMTFSKMHHGLSDNLYYTAKQMLDPDGKIREATFRDCSSHHIIDKCFRCEDVFNLMFPEAPKKSPQQIKIEELQATIDRACQEIKELREMGEKK